MYINNLFNAYKKAKNYVQDKQIAHDLGLTPQKISKIRSGERQLTENEAIFLAKELNLSIEEVLLYVAADRSKHDEAKQSWENLIKKFKRQGLLKLDLQGLSIACAGLATLLTSKVECALSILC